MELKEAISEALTDAVIEIFSTTLGVVPSVKEGHFDLGGVDANGLIASIGMAGRIEGALVLIFSETCACKVVSKMFAIETNEMSADIIDGVGEISNILAGGLKVRIAPLGGYDFAISLPTVVQGRFPMNVTDGKKTDLVELHVTCGELSFGVKCFFGVKLSGPAASTEKDAAKAKENIIGNLKGLIEGR